MATLRLEKRNDELPTEITPNTLYLVKKDNKVYAYLSDEIGTQAYPIVASENGITPIMFMLGASAGG